VRRVLSSPRRRRRLVWGGACALVVGGVAFSMIHWSNTAPTYDTPVRTNEPAQILADPIATPFKRARSEGVMAVAAQFVDTAVKRRHVERSYELVTPLLRTGYTKRAWATQDIPVQPFPLESARYQLKGSFTDHVWLQVALYPDKAHKETVPSAVFDVVLKPFGRGDDRHWLVDSWAPAGYLQIPSGPLGGARDATGHVIPPAEIEWKGKLSQKWLFLPVSALGVGLIMIAAIGFGSWWRGRRALQRYKSTYR
jgi:hypothetical protein